MSPELPPFCNARARARIRPAQVRLRRPAPPRRTASRFAFAAASYAGRGLLTAFSIGILLLAWYSISRDQQEQQVIREQTARINAIAPGP